MTDYLETNSTLQGLYPTSEDFEEAFEDCGLTSGTLPALYQSFYWRQVCDNDYFTPILRALFLRYGQQYNDLLRLQLTRIDPMVTQYLERETTHGGTDQTTTSGSTTHGLNVKTTHDTTDTVTHGLSITQTHNTTDTLKHGETITGDHDTTDATEHGLNVKTTHDTTDTTTHDTTDARTLNTQETLQHGETITTSGTENRSTKTNQTLTTDETITTAKRTTASSGTSSGKSSTDNRSLAASLPRVDSYTANGFPAAETIKTGEATGTDGTTTDTTAAGVLAQAMDWRLADTQSEQAGIGVNSGETTGTTAVTVEAPDTSKTVTAYTGDPDTDNLSRDMSDTHSGSDVTTRTGTDTTTHTGTDTTARTGSETVANTGTDTTTHTGKDTTTHAGSDVTTRTGTDTTAHSGNDRTARTGSETVANTGTDSTAGTVTTAHDTTDRERYTGRNGAAGDLLQKAADFIEGTGAFSWLCRRVDTCFLDIYDY